MQFHCVFNYISLICSSVEEWMSDEISTLMWGLSLHTTHDHLLRLALCTADRVLPQQLLIKKLVPHNCLPRIWGNQMQISCLSLFPDDLNFSQVYKINHHTDLLDSSNSENIFITQYSRDHHVRFLILSFLYTFLIKSSLFFWFHIYQILRHKNYDNNYLIGL